jgi:virginiamycin B lyase
LHSSGEKFPPESGFRNGVSGGGISGPFRTIRPGAVALRRQFPDRAAARRPSEDRLHRTAGPGRAPLRVLAAVVVIIALLSGCTGLAERDPMIKRGPVAAPTTTIPAAAFAGGDPLIAALRRGGHVLIVRHGVITDETGAAAAADGPLDCAAQPRLTAAGRRQAAAIGSALRRLGVPIGTVLAAPACAARDTAFGAFGRVEGSNDLREPASQGERRALGRRLRAMASARHPAGVNTVLVTYGPNVAAAFGIAPAPGEMLVMAPRSGIRARLVQRVRAGAWSTLARDAGPGPEVLPRLTEYPVPAGSRPFDVAPARDGTVWWTAQASGQLGRLDPRTRRSRLVKLGAGSAPRGIIVGPDGAPWIADAGLNAIVRVDPRTHAVRRWPLPEGRAGVSLSQVAFDASGLLWFTGETGVIGRLEPSTARIEVFDAPVAPDAADGPGPAGIAATAKGEVFYASMAGSHLGKVDPGTGMAEIVEPPTREQGARQLWSDERGRIWLSEWNAGQLGVFDPASGGWREWRLPGPSPRPEAVLVDARDQVWLSDADANALVRFDPVSERFTTVPLPAGNAEVRHLAARKGEVWGAESGADRLIVARE